MLPGAHGGLYIGGKAEAKDLAALRSLQITTIVNLTPSREEDPQGGVPNYHEASERRIRYLRVPLYDNAGQTFLPILDRVLAEIVRGLHYGGVLVHCSKGVSRSAAIIAAYLMRTHGLGVDAAVAFLRERRPVVAPNAAFTRQLREFALGVEQQRKTGALPPPEPLPLPLAAASASTISSGAAVMAGPAKRARIALPPPSGINGGTAALIIGKTAVREGAAAPLSGGSSAGLASSLSGGSQSSLHGDGDHVHGGGVDSSHRVPPLDSPPPPPLPASEAAQGVDALRSPSRSPVDSRGSSSGGGGGSNDDDDGGGAAAPAPPLGGSIVVPVAAEEAYVVAASAVVQCEECAEEQAAVHCWACSVNYCGSCDAEVHAVAAIGMHHGARVALSREGS